MKRILVITFLLNTCLAFSQTIYKKGYITTLENKTVEGYVILQKSNTYYHQVSFTTDKKVKPTIYTPEMINGYGYSKTSVFEAIDIPAIEKGFLVENGAIERKFLKVFTTSESLTFYKIYDNGEKKYFIKNEFEELIPLVFDKKDVDKYKVNTGTYKLPTGELININETATVTASNGKIYTLENQKLYEVQPVFKNELQKIATSKGCDVEDNLKTMKLSQVSFSSFSKTLEKCTNEPSELLDKTFLPQISILAIGSTHPYTRDFHIGYEYGFLIELRENTLSPNFSIAFGLSQNDSSVNIVDYFFEGGRSTKALASVNSNNILLKFNYHFMHGKKIRPYASFNSKIYRSQIHYSYINTREYLKSELDYNYILSGSLGVDYYLFRYIQLRAEVEYSGIFSYQVGLGISIN